MDFSQAKSICIFMKSKPRTETVLAGDYFMAYQECRGQQSPFDYTWKFIMVQIM